MTGGNQYFDWTCQLFSRLSHVMLHGIQ